MDQSSQQLYFGYLRRATRAVGRLWAPQAEPLGAYPSTCVSVQNPSRPMGLVGLVTLVGLWLVSPGGLCDEDHPRKASFENVMQSQD
ncbi:MAG TPA: hypothetical protein PK129_11990, partial [Cellvibrionaceae bacterium]|nr:hypothetical protein [Cellvibrionaceae bacterium]